ncbi:hypothetical protein QQP08_014547 [Theobroma cacao]|nr:hypothetical protein QQP08_014547 [Theobroma cacao]
MNAYINYSEKSDSNLLFFLKKKKERKISVVLRVTPSTNPIQNGQKIPWMGNSSTRQRLLH